jgi:H+/Cl- antiporter ClcA
MKQTYRQPLLIFACVSILVGTTAGLGGVALGLLLRFVQHLAYGYSIHSLTSHESFLQGVSAATPIRRFIALTICGIVAGVGWPVLYRFGKPLVPISEAISSKDATMPFFTTIFHDVLQIITVGLGSPLGREVAPREIGAVFASRLSNRAGLTAEDTRIMIACGAGAGLAAVYNVPLAGTLFILEALLSSFRPRVLIPAMITCGIATLVSWIGLGNDPQYTIAGLTVTPSLFLWAVIAGPVFGVGAYAFVRLANAARSKAPKDWRLACWSLVVFPMIGLLAIRFPQILGNGKSIVRLGFDGEIGVVLALTLFVIRVVITLASLRAGATGGLMTPGIAIGVLLASVTGALWKLIWPAVPLGAFGIVGGAAFLASSMNMPLTAIAMMMEFTHVDIAFLLPMMFAVAGSQITSILCRRHWECDERVSRNSHK